MKKVPWNPKFPNFYNYCMQPCDMLVGRCRCGYFHEEGEFKMTAAGQLLRFNEPAESNVTSSYMPYAGSKCEICDFPGQGTTCMNCFEIKSRLADFIQCGRQRAIDLIASTLSRCSKARVVITK